VSYLVDIILWLFEVVFFGVIGGIIGGLFVVALAYTFDFVTGYHWWSDKYWRNKYNGK